MSRVVGLARRSSRGTGRERAKAGGSGRSARWGDTVRGEDVAFISYGRLPKDTQITGFLEIPAELIIEVLGDDTSWAEMEKKIGEFFGG